MGWNGNKYIYAQPNEAYNSRRSGLLVNIPPDNGDPSNPHRYDPTCLCKRCVVSELSLRQAVQKEKL